MAERQRKELTSKYPSSGIKTDRAGSGSLRGSGSYILQARRTPTTASVGSHIRSGTTSGPHSADNQVNTGNLSRPNFSKERISHFMSGSVSRPHSAKQQIQSDHVPRQNAATERTDVIVSRLSSATDKHVPHLDSPREAWSDGSVDHVAEDEVARKGNDESISVIDKERVENFAQELRATKETVATALDMITECGSSFMKIVGALQEDKIGLHPGEQGASPKALTTKYYGQTLQLKRENATLKNDLEKYEHTVDALRKDNDQLQREKEDLVLKMAASEKEYQRQKSEFAKYRKDSEKRTKQTNEECQGLMAELNALKAQLEDREKSRVDSSNRTMNEENYKDLKQDNIAPNEDLTIHNGTYDQLRNQNTELLQEQEKLIMTQRSLERDRDREKSEIEKYAKQVLVEKRELETKIKSAESELTQKEQVYQHALAEIKSLRTKMKKAEETKADASSMVEQYQKESVQIRENNETLMSELQTQKETMEKLFKQNEDLLHEREILQVKHASLEREHRKLGEKFDLHSEQTSADKSAFEEQIAEIEHKMRQKDIECQQANAELMSMKSRADEAEQAKKDALSRLSRQMGQKVSEGNAAIADLSDNDRPTKLAEKYNEMYDNVWTDSLASLTEDHDMSENEAVHILLDIMMDCFSYCTKTADKQTSDLYKNLLLCENVDQDLLPSDVKARIADARKASSSFAYKNAFEAFRRKLDRGTYPHQETACYVEQYVKECFEVCWQMRLREPPLALAPLPNSGETFDWDLYKEYTKHGSEVDYAVWPALLLHKDGPMLGKGVIQPKEEPKFHWRKASSTRDRKRTPEHSEVNGTSPTANSTDKTRMSKSVYGLSNFHGRSRADPETTDIAKPKTYTEHAVPTSRVERTDSPRSRTDLTRTRTDSPTNRTPGKQNASQTYGAVARNYNDRHDRSESVRSSSWYTTPSIAQSGLDEFVNYCHRLGYDTYKAVFGKQKAETMLAYARSKGLLE